MNHKLSLLAMASGILVWMASCSGTLRLSAFEEAHDPTLDTLSDWSGVSEGLWGSFVSPYRAFKRSVVPDVNSTSVFKLTGWRGERLSAQLLLWSETGVQHVEVKIPTLRSENGAIPEDALQSRFVRYVLSDEFGNACGWHDPALYPPHLVPDMLDDIDCFDLDAHSVRPIWITVSVPFDALAGQYCSRIQVRGKGIKSLYFDLYVEVLDRQLPPPSEWNYYLDLWQHPSAVARVEKVELWSDSHFEALIPYMEMLADAGQKTITATLNKDPWNHQCYDDYADMIVWTRHGPDSWSYDYRIFDRWVELMMSLGINRHINCYSMLPWNNELCYRDELTGEIQTVQAVPGTTRFRELWGPFLADFVRHLREKGWLERTNIAMDERTSEQLGLASDFLRETAPELGIAMADNKNSFSKYPFVNNMCVKVRDRVPSEYLVQRRAQGFVTTYYVCCSDRFPNVFTFSNPAEAVYAGWYASACGYDGFLRWAYNSWPEHPLVDSRFRTFPAGDTYLIYPGPRSSVRFELLRTGIQDAEKIAILRREFASENMDMPDSAIRLQRLDTLLEPFATLTPEVNWVECLEKARQDLNELSRRD